MTDCPCIQNPVTEGSLRFLVRGGFFCTLRHPSFGNLKFSLGNSHNFIKSISPDWGREIYRNEPETGGRVQIAIEDICFPAKVLINIAVLMSWGRLVPAGGGEGGGGAASACHRPPPYGKMENVITEI